MCVCINFDRVCFCIFAYIHFVMSLITRPLNWLYIYALNVILTCLKIAPVWAETLHLSLLEHVNHFFSPRKFECCDPSLCIQEDFDRGPYSLAPHFTTCKRSAASLKIYISIPNAILILLITLILYCTNYLTNPTVTDPNAILILFLTCILH